jgi:hypothetical protein
MKKKLTNAQVDVVTKEVFNKIREEKNKALKVFLKNNASHKEWIRLKKEEYVLRDKLSALGVKTNNAFNNVKGEVFSEFNLDVATDYSTTDKYLLQLHHSWSLHESIKHRLILGTIDGDDINDIINNLIKEFNK